MLVIFDCDGVLVETESLSAEVLKECLKTVGVECTTEEIFSKFRGKSIADCAAIVAQLLKPLPSFRHFEEEALNDSAVAFWRNVQLKTLEAFQQGVQPIDGIAMVLQSLIDRQVSHCVASNGRHEKMQLTLTQSGLIKYFPEGSRFSATDVSVGKPAPDLFLHAAATMGIAAENAWVVEDSPSGVEAALRAGMKVIAYCSAHETAETIQHMKDRGAIVIHDMRDVLQYIY